jgi:hypothetical protein
VKFIPKEIKENVNISSQSPLREFLLLLTTLLGIIILVYISLGLAVDLIVPKLPQAVEMRLGRMYSGTYESKKDKKNVEAEIELQRILDGLIEKASDKEPYKVYLIYSPQANALACLAIILL